MSRAKAPPETQAGYDEDEILRRHALTILTDPASSVEDRAVAELRLLTKAAPTIDDLDSALAELSFDQVAALAALDGELGTEHVPQPEGGSTQARRDAAHASLITAEVEAVRRAILVAKLDEELAAETARPTPAPAPVELAPDDDDDAPEPIVSEPIASPRTPDEWRAYARRILEQHKVAEAERAAQRKADFETKRAAMIAEDQREQAQRRRERGERDD
jgi:hypothetical protein